MASGSKVQVRILGIKSATSGFKDPYEEDSMDQAHMGQSMTNRHLQIKPLRIKPLMVTDFLGNTNVQLWAAPVRALRSWVENFYDTTSVYKGVGLESHYYLGRRRS